MTLQTTTGQINHTELISADADATCRFLADLFGLELTDMGGEAGPYFTFATSETAGGAVRPVAEGEPGPGVCPYFTVPDLEAALPAATHAGAKVLVPRQPVPERGWFAWLAIPGGCTIALWQDDPNAS